MNVIQNVLIVVSVFCVLSGAVFLIFIDKTCVDRLLSIAMILFGTLSALSAYSDKMEG